jgi:hypothetical protein
MRRALAILCAMASLIVLTAQPSRAVVASAPWDQGRAGMCDAFDGLAFTFCVAICEARMCDLLVSEDERCMILERGFDRVTDGAAPPCLLSSFASTVAP